MHFKSLFSNTAAYLYPAGLATVASLSVQLPCRCRPLGGGREVTLWPDADEPGGQSMARLAGELDRIGAAAGGKSRDARPDPKGNPNLPGGERGGRDLDPGVAGKHPGQEQHPRRRVERDGGARVVETPQEGQTEGAVESGRRRRRAS